MKYRKRTYYTEEQAALMWDRCQRGDSIREIAIVDERSLRSIALRLGRAPSTVSREVNRNGGRDGYSTSGTDEAAWDRGLRPKDCKLARHRALARLVAGRLKLQWSPEEIAIKVI